MSEHERRAVQRERTRRPWALIAVAVFVLGVAAIFFSSAGPDRSRIPELKGTSPYAENPTKTPTEKSLIPNVDMPTTPKAR